MNFGFSEEEKTKFFEVGYCIFDIGCLDIIDLVNDDIAKLSGSGAIKTNSKIYSYNDSPRLVESWKHSENCRRLVKESSIASVLSYLYDEEPRAFSTINFLRSTEQPLHSDYVHFGTIPELRLAGSWIALEDINPRSGPLAVVPRSHKLPIFDFGYDLQLPVPSTMSELKSNYALYEEWVSRTIERYRLSVVTPLLKKGECIIWHANLLHGSPACADNQLSRRSQVIHWDFKSVTMHYNPNFSRRAANRYIARPVTYI